MDDAFGAEDAENEMNEDSDGWPDDVEPEPTDDNRALRSRRDDSHAAHGTVDYAEAVTGQDTAWWSALSDYEYGYALLRALESACERGAPLHLARCVHHLHDLLSGLDPDDRARAEALLGRIRDLLARRAGSGKTAVALPVLLAYLSDVRADPRFAPPLVLPLGLLHRMYPQGVKPAELQEALDRHLYPRGKPLPPCPLCEPDRADPANALTHMIATLTVAQRDTLSHLGHALALDGDAPDLAAQWAWVTGKTPVPALYRAILIRARGDDTLDAVTPS